MAHTCTALVLHCIDFRIQDAVERFLAEHKLLGDADVLAVPGAAKDLVRDGILPTKGMLAALGVSATLHHITDVHLINHTDCGAYGGRTAFGSSEEEWAAHEADLRAAADVLRTAYPHLTIHLHLAVISEGADAPTVHVEDLA